jgi:hypothetical protein
MTLEEIVNGLKSAGQDYSQLFNNNPRYTGVASNVTKGLENLVPPQFTNTQDAKSQEYSKKLADWALGNGMGMAGMALAIKIPNPIKDNLNATLLQKYLSVGKLSPKEMTQYEANALAMETPQLQRYNVQNAMANPERQSYKDTLNVPVYHGTNADITAMSVEGKGKTRGAGAFVGTNPIASETYVQGFQGGNILPLLLNDKDLLKVNAKGQHWSDILTDSLYSKRKPLTDVLPLEKNDYTSTDELGQLAKDAGYKGITIKNLEDLGLNSHIFRAKDFLKDKYNIDVNPEFSNVSGDQFVEARNFMEDQYKKQKSDVTAINDPSLLRSRFAAFDPLRKNSSSLLASGLLGALLLNNENKTSEER